MNKKDKEKMIRGLLLAIPVFLVVVICHLLYSLITSSTPASFLGLNRYIEDTILFPVMFFLYWVIDVLWFSHLKRDKKWQDRSFNNTIIRFPAISGQLIGVGIGLWQGALTGIIAGVLVGLLICLVACAFYLVFCLVVFIPVLIASLFKKGFLMLVNLFLKLLKKKKCQQSS